MTGSHTKKHKKGLLISVDHHVVRHIPFPNLRRSGDGKILGVLPQAFSLRTDEAYLSVNWLEFFESNKATNLLETKNAIAAAKASGKISPSSALAIANVGKLKEACLTKSDAQIRVAYAPSKNNPSHTAIHNLPSNDLELLDLLAEDIFTEQVLVSKI